MIFFPFLYEDELLYSIFARYHFYSGNENTKVTMSELFSSESVCASVAFPAHLKTLSQNLPTPGIYDSSYFIQGHTFIPYYAPFIPEKVCAELSLMMSEGNGTALFMKLGKTASTVKSPKHLKYCIECIEDDRVANGEAYWHRTHQVEGVMVCPQHSSWLIDSDVPYAERKNKHEFISLEQTIKNNEAGKNNSGIADTEYKNLVYIAEQTYFLLINNIKPLGLNNIKQFYVVRLQQKGLATVTGRIKWTELIPLFNQYYGDKILSAINCFVGVTDVLK